MEASEAAQVEGGSTPTIDTSASTDTSTSTETVAEVTPTETTTDTQTETTPEVVQWNGELDGLQSASWFTGLDESVRNQFTHGYSNKVKNLERGFTEKTTKLANDRKAFETEQADAKALQEGMAKQLKETQDTLKRYQRWIRDGTNPSDELRNELKASKAKVEEILKAQEALKSGHEEAIAAALKKLQGESDKKYNGLNSQYDELKRQHENLKQQHENYIQEQHRETLQTIHGWVNTEHPQLLKDGSEPALETFMMLLQNGVTDDPKLAVQMITPMYPQLFRTETRKTVPKAMDAMSGSTPTGFSPGPVNGTSRNPVDNYNRLKNELLNGG